MPNYYANLAGWPLAPHRKLLVGVKFESPEAIENLDDTLASVCRISPRVPTGEGHCSKALGYARQYEHPKVLGTMLMIVEICKKHDASCRQPLEQGQERREAAGARDTAR